MTGNQERRIEFFSFAAAKMANFYIVATIFFVTAGTRNGLSIQNAHLCFRATTDEKHRKADHSGGDGIDNDYNCLVTFLYF